ncbi:hypothetical protein [Natronorubrum daqingense]|uniref:Uncharacterized protein n=1 Tax=Natronorubrum daqingense TaxID=588898 RepID=A0A1N7G571_9EURY|nr:hypothetical protein [Natronorubrum daqingense]APX98720.1 hypothetical protein BB347_18615 [Natronorubrum daqingense]SIS07753.1 hypothetical protein SAMN05421809_3738 [Natronorubrum daqingense]
MSDQSGDETEHVVSEVAVRMVDGDGPDYPMTQEDWDELRDAPNPFAGSSNSDESGIDSTLEFLQQ